jgi:hypothetical protein|tara:strand:+ start:312 stop:692 length:381 start_codon:yes stop_codon:yes gene_type:complete
MKGNNMNTWNTIGRDQTHIRDMEDQSLKGKAICGVRFTYFSAMTEVEEGSRVNCARCLVKVGWAKKVGSHKVENKTVGVQREIGFSETYYELVKPLLRSALRVEFLRKMGDWEIGQAFYTNTENAS